MKILENVSSGEPSHRYLQQIDLISQLIDALLRSTNARNLVLDFRDPSEQL
jgi:hypothetical protein